MNELNIPAKNQIVRLNIKPNPAVYMPFAKDLYKI